MLADKGYDPKMGARPLSRKIDELIRVPLSKKILFEQLRDADIDADLVDDKVVFVASRAYNPVDSNGIINIGGVDAEV